MTSTKPVSGGASPPRRIYQILAGQMFDSITRTLVPNQVITIDGDAGVILDVSPQSMARRPEEVLSALSSPSTKKGGSNAPLEVTRINYSHLVVIPGLVDVHVHLFLHPYSEVSWNDQLLTESLTERTVRATVHARKTLLAGFTTVRDLGTEGAFDADIGLRKCLSGRETIIPGPRYYCATKAIVSTGSYGPKSSLYPAQEGIDGVQGAEPADGVHECVRAVRRQIGAGADWIKVRDVPFSDWGSFELPDTDYRCRSRQSDVSSSLGNKSIATFNREELSAMVTEAHARGVKVAAHANTAQAIDMLLDLEIDSIEHGAEIYDSFTRDKALIRKFLRKETTWVPTLAAYYTTNTNAGGTGYTKQMWDRCKASFEEVLSSGMEHIACGGDTGVFAHGDNALEMVLMRKLGAGWERVLGWATYGGWKCVRGMEWDGEKGEKRVKDIESRKYLGSDPPDRSELDREVPFGAIRIGWAADLVGIEGKIDGSVQDFEAAITKGVNFVMKGGRVYKKDGIELLVQ